MPDQCGNGDAPTFAEAKGIKAGPKIADHLPIMGDPFAIGLIVQNLIDKMTKYNQRSGCIRLCRKHPLYFICGAEGSAQFRKVASK